jgi:hypothetical protein
MAECNCVKLKKPLGNDGAISGAFWFEVSPTAILYTLPNVSLQKENIK